MIAPLRALCFTTLLACAAAGCGAGKGQKSSVESVLATLEAINGDRSASVSSKSSRMSDAWLMDVERLLAAPRAASNEELDVAFDATNLVLFYATLAGDGSADAWLDRLKLIHSELHRRGVVEGEQAAHVFEHLVTLRRFEEARTLRDAVPALHVLSVPTVQFAEGFRDDAPAAMTRRADGTWHVENVALADVGMVAVIGCPTSAKAVAAIAMDAPLMKKLGDVGVVWLADASAMYAAEGWNAELPGQPMQVAWRNGAWLGIAFDAMPSFFFLRNGRVVAHDSQGWENGPMQSRLHASLDQLR